MFSKTHILFFFFALALFSCNEDDTPIPIENEFAVVEDRLQPFFLSFEEEAAIRGFDIDLNEANISAVIREIDGQGVAGQCRRTFNNLDNDIVIDESFFNNDRIQFLIKELVVFHEIGHCFLQRDHREDSLPNGSCLSIMRSGLEDCQDNYTRSTRAFYLDELFNPSEF